MSEIRLMCPHCRKPQLIDRVSQNTCINLVTYDPDSAQLSEGEVEIQTGHTIRFQCNMCGTPIKDDDGQIIQDDIDLIEQFEKHSSVWKARGLGYLQLLTTLKKDLKDIPEDMLTDIYNMVAKQLGKPCLEIIHDALVEQDRWRVY